MWVQNYVPDPLVIGYLCIVSSTINFLFTVHAKKWLLWHFHLCPHTIAKISSYYLSPYGCYGRKTSCAHYCLSRSIYGLWSELSFLTIFPCNVLQVPDRCCIRVSIVETIDCSRLVSSWPKNSITTLIDSSWNLGKMITNYSKK